MDDINIEKKESASLSVKDILFKYIKYLPIVLACTVLGYLGARLYLRYAEETYMSYGTMLLKTDEGQGDKVEQLLKGRSSGRNMANEIEVLRSKQLLQRVVEDLGLEYTITAKGKVKDLNVYKSAPFELAVVRQDTLVTKMPFSFAIHFVSPSQFKIDNKANLYNLGQDFTTPYGTFRLNKLNVYPPKDGVFDISYKPAPLVATSLINKTAIQPKLPGTAILNISHETNNPELAADIVNAIMAEYNVSSVEQGNAAMDLTIGFVDKRLALLNQDIDSLQRKLIAYQKSNNLIDAQLQMQNYMSDSKAQEELLVSRRMDLSNLSQVESYLKNKGNQYNRSIAPSTLGINDVTLNQLVTRYNEAVLERKAQLEANVPPENPKMIELSQNIEALRKSTLENINLLKNNYAKTLGITTGIKSQKNNEALNMPAKVNEQVELQRQLNAKLALYKILDEKKEEASISRASTMPISQILQKAEVNKTPVKPVPTTIKLIGIFLGLALPVLFIAAKEMLNDRISTRQDIERNTTAPILGEVGHSYKPYAMVVTKTSRSVIAEQFRILRSNLQYIIGKKDKYTILVTSSFGGEGKSFVSTNMAAVLSLVNKKTVVLEFDLRKPRILAGLNMNSHKGVTNYMVNDLPLDELLIPVKDYPDLFIMPCGPIPPNPSELLLSDRMDKLFASLKERFDVIIIDTAPVGMVSDAMTLAKYADCTLYVTRQGHTYKRQISLIEDMYQGKKLPHVSVILNDVQMPTGGAYYGNYGYGYYGYGEKGKNDYYADEDLPKRSIGRKILDAFNPQTWFIKK